jgi:hypothetical protein
MYDKLVYAVLIVSIIFLVLVYVNYKLPSKEVNETDAEYQTRLNDYNCVYYGNRNMLLAVIIISSSLYAHKSLGKARVSGGSVVHMSSVEPNLYKGKKEYELDEVIVDDDSDD